MCGQGKNQNEFDDDRSPEKRGVLNSIPKIYTKSIRAIGRKKP